jgi:N-acetylneuraminic acid mutarotase
VTSASRLLLVFGVIASLMLMACDSTVVPNAPATKGQPVPSPSNAASAPAPTPPGSPTPSASVTPAADGAVWLDAGDLQEGRNATNVVVVGAAEVLVVGSDYRTSWQSACGAATNGSDSIEIGDPDARTWEKTASLTSPREDPSVVALLDGRALMTGGQRGENFEPAAFSSTYVFDPATRLWSRSGLLHTARYGSAAAVLQDGRVLVAGGMYLDKTVGPRVLDSSELWDPGSGAWSRVGRLAQTRGNASAVVLTDGRVLIVGGIEDDSSAEQASAEVYDPASGRWAPAGTLATARRGFALIALSDGGALVAGGMTAGGFTRLSSVERFDPASDTWSEAEDLPVAVAGAAGIRLLDGRVLMAGGSAHDREVTDWDAGTFVSGLTRDAALFDADTGAWSPTERLPSPRAGASAVLLPDGSALLAGGSDSEGPPDTPSCPEADSQVFRYVPGS